MKITRWAAVMVALFLFGQGVVAQSSFGIGVVNVNFDDKTVIQFYDRPGAAVPARTVRFFNDKAIKSWSIVNLESERKWLDPESMWLDYHSFTFRCLSKRPGWFELVVNKKSGKSYWVRSSPKLVFDTWEGFLKGVASIARDPRFPQKLRSSPSDFSRALAFRGDDCFDVRAMRGDWIRVAQAGNCEKRDSRFRSGWIRWRRGQTLLIEYFITT